MAMSAIYHEKYLLICAFNRTYAFLRTCAFQRNAFQFTNITEYYLQIHSILATAKSMLLLTDVVIPLCCILNFWGVLCYHCSSALLPLLKTKRLKSMCCEADWLMQYNYLFCSVQSTESRLNFYGSKNSRSINKVSRNNRIPLQTSLLYLPTAIATYAN